METRSRARASKSTRSSAAFRLAACRGLETCKVKCKSPGPILHLLDYCRGCVAQHSPKKHAQLTGQTHTTERPLVQPVVAIPLTLRQVFETERGAYPIIVIVASSRFNARSSGDICGIPPRELVVVTNGLSCSGSRHSTSSGPDSCVPVPRSWESYFLKTFNWTVFENEMKWYHTEGQRGQLNYRDADALMAWADKHALKVRGHCIFWEVRARDDNLILLKLRSVVVVFETCNLKFKLITNTVRRGVDPLRGDACQVVSL